MSLHSTLYEEIHAVKLAGNTQSDILTTHKRLDGSKRWPLKPEYSSPDFFAF